MDGRFNYRVHWVTAVAQLVVGGALVYCQSNGFITHYGNNMWKFPTGWPFMSHGGHWPAMANLLFAISMLASVSFVMELRMQRPGGFLQFQLSSLIAFIGVLATLLALWRAFPTLTVELGFQPQSTWPLIHPNYIALLPILFGLGCTIYTGGWLAMRLIRRMLGNTPQQPPPP